MATSVEQTPLNILIVGGGIGGLTAASGFRQQGHRVTIFERSRMLQEVGAAVHLAPNCHGILKRIGVFPETFGAVPITGMSEFTEKAKQTMDLDLTGLMSIWENTWVLSHRVNLHDALRKQATSSEGAGEPATLHTGSRVVDVDPETATITLEDGTSVSGDLVLGADGVSSITRSVVAPGVKPYRSGKSCFRFLIPMQDLANDPRTKEFAEKPGHLVLWISRDRRIVMYPCSKNTIMNCAAFIPSELADGCSKGDGWGRQGSKELLLQLFDDFEPRARGVLEVVDPAELKLWSLLDMERIPTWYKGRLVLLGDAAHPFLPHQGQGAGIAIEDAASLVALLPLGTAKDDIPERLALYEKLRDERAHKIQMYTRLAGEDVTENNGKRLDMSQFLGYNMNHDEWHTSSRALKELLWSKAGPFHKRAPTSFGPIPGPGQDHHGRLATADDSASTTWSVRFKTSATYLRTLFPTAQYTLFKPGTVAEASLVCTEFKDVKWLSGRGYRRLGLWIHGVEYKGKDDSSVRGSYLPVLFGNQADSVVADREELGLPSILCDIDVEETGSSAKIRCSWQGTTFVDVTVQSLQEAKGIESNGSDSKSPEEQGTLVHRYIPSVGQPGVADADYAVLVEGGLGAKASKVESSAAAGDCEIKLTAGDWNTLPTLHHVATGLAETPIYGTVESTVVRGRGVELSHARRLE